jgi:hypothetical protein
VSVAEFISSVAWPVAVLVIALLFRRPIIDALGSPRGALSAGPFRLEWQRRAAEVEADLGQPTSIAEGRVGGAAGRLEEIAAVSPVGAVVESFGQIEKALRTALEERGIEGPQRNWSVRRLAEVAQEQGVITAETKDAIDGLSVMRNLAAHGDAEDISSERAREFLALSHGVLYAIQMNSKRQSDGPSSKRPDAGA